MSQCWQKSPYISPFHQTLSAPVMSTDMSQVGHTLPFFLNFLSFNLSRFSFYMNNLLEYYELMKEVPRLLMLPAGASRGEPTNASCLRRNLALTLPDSCRQYRTSRCLTDRTCNNTHVSMKTQQLWPTDHEVPYSISCSAM